MPTSAQYELADLKTGGNLPRLLAEWRAQGLSFHQIARKLEQWDVQVTSTTVWRWTARLEAGQ